MGGQVIKLVLVLEDGSVPAGTAPPLEAYEQEIRLTQWGDFEVHFDFWKADRTAAPIPTGGAFELAVRRQNYSEAAPIAVQATITDPAGGEDCGYFPVDSSLAGALQLIATYTGGIVYVDADGKRWQVLPESVVPVEAAIANPDTPVTPGASQPLLGLSQQSFRRTIVQPDDGDTVAVAIPSAARLPAGTPYAVQVTLASAVEFTSFAVPLETRTDTDLIVLTGGALPDGAVLEITISSVIA